MAHSEPIPAFDYLRELATYRSQIDQAVAQVLESGSLILGQQVHLFELEFARVLGVQYAVGVASGTDALKLALRAIGIKSGDGVVTVANTAVPTVSAIRDIGAMPMFVDIDPRTLQMSVRCLEEFLQSRPATKARCVLPVHLHGQAAEMQAINNLASNAGLTVIGDCAQAHGTKIHQISVAGMADISCYSFYPTKNLAAFGDGGMCVTNSQELATALRELRQYGFRSDRVAYREGICSRLDELQAAILRVRLEHFAAAQQARERIAGQYIRGLADCPLELPCVAANTTHAWHQFVIRSERRTQIIEALQRAQIGFGIHYPIPIHLIPAYDFLGYRPGDLPVTEQAAGRILSLPMFPTLAGHEVQRVIDTIRKNM